SNTLTAAVPGEAIINPINNGISIFAYEEASAHSLPRNVVIIRSPKSKRHTEAPADNINNPISNFTYHPNTGRLLFFRSAMSTNITLRIELATSVTGWLIICTATPYIPTCANGIYFTKISTGKLEEKLNIALDAVKYLGKSTYLLPCPAISNVEILRYNCQSIFLLRSK